MCKTNLLRSRVVAMSTVAAALLACFTTSSAQVVVYENLGTSALGGTSRLNSENPIFGDALNLTQSGQLSLVGLSLFNSSSGGNTGAILTGTMVVNFYDNTTAYAGGSLSAGRALLGSATVNWDFSADGGLLAGFYATDTFDLTANNINLTSKIFVTQKFTLTSGTSTRNGVILFDNPTTGTSTSTVYLYSSAVAEGLYTFTGNPGQFGYHLEVTLVPEPATLALAGLGAFALLALRRRK